MSISLRRFRIGGFTWFLMIILIVIAYYWLIDDIRIFYIVAGITILVMFILMFFIRSEHSKGKANLDTRIQQYHSDKLRRREKAYNVRFCENCKYKLDKDSTFCSHCGNEVE